MKFLGLFCFLIGILKPFSAKAYDSSSCYEALQEDYDEILSIQGFIYFLVDFEIYSTADFVKLKQGGLPDGVPDKPLREYPQLKKKWSNLWRRVNKIRSDKEIREQILALITENKYITIFGIVDASDFTKAPVKRIINQLKEEGTLIYTGSQSNGYWEILENGAEPSPNPLEKTKEQVLAHIAENRHISVLEISNKTELSISVIRYAINKLREEGKLARIGSDHSGYWEILKNGATPSSDPMEERKKQILMLITENSKIIIREMVSKTNYTKGEVGIAIEKLKQEGKLARIGSEWEILENGATPSPDPMEERKKQILMLITENSKIIIREMANKTGYTKREVRTAIEKLKQEEKLARIGSEWEVLENGAKPSPNPIEERKKQILMLITENSKIIIREMVSKTNYTKGEVGTAIEKLKQEGKLARIGSEWKILKKGAQPSRKEPVEQKREQSLIFATEITIYTDKMDPALKVTASKEP